MSRRSLQIDISQTSSPLDAISNLVRQINESFSHLEEFESFVRSEDGQTFTLSGDIDLGGNRVRNAGRSKKETEYVSRAELRDLSLFVRGNQPFIVTRRIIAGGGIESSPADLPRDVVTLNQLKKLLANLAAVNVSPEIETAGVLGVIITRFALEDHTHSGVNLSDAQTITPLKTFDRNPSAPFAVTAGSAVVANLDADLLDGEEGDFYRRYALLVS